VQPNLIPRLSRASSGPGGGTPAHRPTVDGQGGDPREPRDPRDGGAAGEPLVVAAAPAPAPVVVGAIPARYASTRLPGKPLLTIAGRPMIEHVYRRVERARGLGRVVVVTDDERIARAVEAFGGEVEMTPADCASGTDRIAHAARGWPAAAAVVNIQGDEPLIDPEAVSRIAEHLAAFPADPMVTLAVPLEAAGAGDRHAGNAGDPGNFGDFGEMASPHVVKVVLSQGGYALYFSRSAIPYPRQAGAATPLRHLGIYGYQRAALLRLAELPPTPLERSEALEQLRALEHGMPIRVLIAGRGSPGVDTEEDLRRVERLLEQGGPL
jgi:3-deoxy-manno-octulosonate cytidylyltransferase (CMP-KDO synthetase)